jgi:hypothetical protein
MTMTREQFMADMRHQWMNRMDPHKFQGFEGDEYNAWLEHRHAWPIDEDGRCAPSVVLSMQDGGGDFSAEECTVCMRLADLYRIYTSGHKEECLDQQAGEITITRLGDDSVAFHFPNGVGDLAPPVDLVLSKTEYDVFNRAHTRFLRTDALMLTKALVGEVRKGFKQLWAEGK